MTDAKQYSSLDDAFSAMFDEGELLNDPVEDYLSLMPMTRASTEEIIQALSSYDGCYELWAALWNDGFSQFLTPQELESLEALYKQVFGE